MSGACDQASGNKPARASRDGGPTALPRVLSLARVDSRWDAAGAHVVVVLLTGVPLAMARFVPLHALPLRACTFHAATGWPCPFCGFTRAFVALAHGDWGHALRDCPLAIPLFTVAVLLFIPSVAAVILGVRIRAGRWLTAILRHPKPVLVIGTLLVAVNWIYRIIATGP